MHDPAVIEALSRIEMEFAAMPGLKLTVPQVNRLCNVSTDVCESALDVLIRSGYLQVSGNALLRPSRRHPRRAIIA